MCRNVILKLYDCGLNSLSLRLAQLPAAIRVEVRILGNNGLVRGRDTLGCYLRNKRGHQENCRQRRQRRSVKHLTTPRRKGPERSTKSAAKKGQHTSCGASRDEKL